MTFIDGFVLTGGASSRMGHDKAQMTIGGKELFERAAAALAGICEHISLVGEKSEDLAANRESNLAAIPDISIAGRKAAKAPIVGLYTALVSSKARWIAVLACDLPFVTPDLFARLARFCSEEFDAIVPLQQDKRPQPLCSFYQSERCLPVVEAMIGRGDLKMQELLPNVRTRFVSFDEIADLDGSADFFLNVNDPADYKTAIARATS